MALPKQSAPVFTLEIPSTSKKVKYRPFLMGEQKALLIAQQSEDPVNMVNTLKAVIKSCINDELDIDSLAMFDLEYIFTQIRAKSVGEISELLFKCDTCEDDKAVTKINLDLTKVKVKFKPEHTNKIELYDNVGIVLKYPGINTLLKLEGLKSDDVNAVFDVVLECVDYIYTDDEVFYAKDQTKTELLEFLNGLTSEQFGKIQLFFETMPKLEQEIDYKCPVCSKKHHKVIEGLTNFF